MNFLSKIKQAKKLIKEYVEKYPEKICLACSFGKDSMVLTHLVRQIKKDIPVISVLSNTEFPETLKLKDKVIKKWKLNYIERLYENQQDKPIDECCRHIKVEKFKEVLRDYDCWIAGLRRDEGDTRRDVAYVVERDGLVKINPILDFTEKEIWKYIALFKVPVNPLYKEYRSLSCSRCSAKEKDSNEAERAGRWVGVPGVCGGECGIHSQSLRK